MIGNEIQSPPGLKVPDISGRAITVRDTVTDWSNVISGFNAGIIISDAEHGDTI